MSRHLRRAQQKRRHATVSEVLHAVSTDSVVGLLVHRTVTAAVAADAIEQLRRLLQNERVENDPRVAPLAEHLRQEEAAGSQRYKLRATRKAGEVVRQKSHARAKGKSRSAVISLATLGNPDEYDVAFGADRIVITRIGEVSVADVGGPPRQPSPDDILAEVETATGIPLRKRGAG